MNSPMSLDVEPAGAELARDVEIEAAQVGALELVPIARPSSRAMLVRTSVQPGARAAAIVARERVVGVQHGVLQARQREQPALRVAVAREIAMLIEMVAREIREHGRVKLEAGDPVLRERVRRHFHRDARRAELRELAVQRERSRASSNRAP